MTSMWSYYVIYFVNIVWFSHFVTLTSQQDTETCRNDNIMGALRHGVIASDNFYFNYRNALTSSTTRSCVHRIYLKHLPSNVNRTICFTFHRFNLEHSTSCSNDYLEFPDTDNGHVKYCGNGTWNRGNEVRIIANVFSPEFCWPAKTSIFEVRFHGDTHINGTGYYATFQVNETGATNYNRNETEIVLCDFDPTKCTQYCFHGHVEIEGCKTCDCINGTTAPCSKSYYTCFNRNCIGQSQVCDGIDDCGDKSDEDYLHARCPGKQGIEACHFNGPDSFHCGYDVVSGWLRDKTSPFGPRYDHTLGTSEGYFMYTADYERSEGEALMTYSNINKDTDHCFSFWYFMSGYVGTLQIKTVSDARSKTHNISEMAPVWRRQGNYDPKWRQAEIDIPKGIFPITMLAIQSLDDTNKYNNIAIDDITLAEGKCWGGDISCLFEFGMCSWSLDKERGEAEWLRNYGPTDSKDTGPDTDRSGNPLGYYLYMEANSHYKGDQAVIISRPISNGDSSTHCLSFWYHMYGNTVNKLEVSALQSDNKTVTLLWSQARDQGNVWKYEVFTIMNVSGPFRLMFIGTVGADFRSDIAIDDIILTKDHCTNNIEPSTSPQPSTTAGPITCPPGMWQCNDMMCINEDFLCDGRFDCGDRSDETGCSGSGDVNIGTILGICIALVIVLGVIVLVIFVVNRKRRNQPPRPVNPSLYYDPTQDDLAIHGYDQHGNHPPPYSMAVDNPTYVGPSSQLPKYDSLSKQPPAYNVGMYKEKKYHPKVDNSSLVGYGASGVMGSNGPYPYSGASTLTISLTSNHPYASDPPPGYNISITPIPNNPVSAPAAARHSLSQSDMGSSGAINTTPLANRSSGYTNVGATISEGGIDTCAASDIVPNDTTPYSDGAGREQSKRKRKPKNKSTRASSSRHSASGDVAMSSNHSAGDRQGIQETVQNSESLPRYDSYRNINTFGLQAAEPETTV